MKHNKFILILSIIVRLTIFAENSGTVDSDIIFTAYEGDSHSLFELLESGKYVYVFTFRYPFDSKSPMVAKKVSKYADVYGRYNESCTCYPLHTIALNINNDITPWHIGYNKGTDLLLDSTGGKEFFDLFNVPHIATIEFIIKPDFTWERLLNATDSLPAIGSNFFTSKRIYPHNHGDLVSQHKCTSPQFQCKYSKNNQTLRINVLQPETVDVVITTIKGTEIFRESNKLLVEGTTTLSQVVLTAGFYVISLHSTSGVMNQRVIVE